MQELQKDFCVPIKLENDAKCAAIAEKEYGSLKGYSDSLFLIIGIFEIVFLVHHDIHEVAEKHYNLN